jgi:hypothetical protein
MNATLQNLLLDRSGGVDATEISRTVIDQALKGLGFISMLVHSMKICKSRIGLFLNQRAEQILNDLTVETLEPVVQLQKASTTAHRDRREIKSLLELGDSLFDPEREAAVRRVAQLVVGASAALGWSDDVGPVGPSWPTMVLTDPPPLPSRVSTF